MSDLFERHGEDFNLHEWEVYWDAPDYETRFAGLKCACGAVMDEMEMSKFIQQLCANKIAPMGALGAKIIKKEIAVTEDED